LQHSKTKTALSLDENYSLARFNAANLYFQHHRWDLALQFYTKTLELMPDYCSALLNRAITRVMLKDMEGAMEDFNKLAMLDPNSPQGMFWH
jgi:tetratricopeptide (TPR) repeat protein